MRDFRGFKILPVLIIVAAISFGLRFGDVVEQLNSGAAMAHAATETPAKRPAARLNDIDTAAGSEAPSAAQLRGADEPEPLPEGAGAPPEKPSVETPAKAAPAAADNAKWKGAEELDDDYSDVKMEMFADLAKRRKDLDAKDQELAMREALLKAAQAELEQKTKELTTIKGDIEALLAKQNAQEEGRIASLVKIYEGMKAKDAARIFDSLEMDVLLQVVTKMSERKTAPIIAAMDPQKARNLTIMLAEQNKLPSIPALPGSLDAPPTATP